MGFCRRCGDIVAGARCKCGGTAVAPITSWNKVNAHEQSQDRWSKTYISTERPPSPSRSPSPTRVHALITQLTGATSGNASSSSGPPSSSPTKRFPRPVPTPSAAVELGSRVSVHIANTTSQLNRPPSPLKQSSTLPQPESSILPSPHTTSLAKVYGSVLQPKDSLPTHSCHICSIAFLPDATIYPDPSAPSLDHFLCRSCYIANGGHKGTCPICSRPVLTLKSEGGFVQADGKYWHKRCFNCDGCSKNIGDKPMVDLLGRPSCPECFDSCLNRGSRTPNRKDTRPPVNNLGGFSRDVNDGEKQEGGSAIKELEQRLGIAGQDQSSLPGSGSPFRPPPVHTTPNSSPFTNSARPSIAAGHRNGSPSPTRVERFKSPELEEELRKSLSRRGSPERGISSPSPIRAMPTGTGSPAAVQSAIEEMKERFLRGTSSSPGTSPVPPKSSTGAKPTTPLRSSRSSPALSVGTRAPASISSISTISDNSDSVPPTPDLMSDFSDSMTQSSSSGPESPPTGDQHDDLFRTAKMYGRGYGSRYTRGDFLEYDEGPRRTPAGFDIDEDIVEEDSFQGTPTPTKSKPAYRATSTTTPTRSSTALPSARARDLPAIPLAPSVPSDNSTCSKCNKSLFSVRGDGHYLSIPLDPTQPDSKVAHYHADCFTCSICGEPFSGAASGRASFIKCDSGPCHLECAPQTKVLVRPKSVGSFAPVRSEMKSPPPSKPSTPTYVQSSSRYERPTPASSSTNLRLGNPGECPGCYKKVSPMEFGVVPGPKGSRWHRACLVCGGKRQAKNIFGREEPRKKGEPGCGKKLDSAAKVDAVEGKVWCRECMLMLPANMRGTPLNSPVKSTMVAEPTGSGSIVPQMTGTTTLARQFTGLGGGDAALLRQLTGGGLSPTRQLASSPTKQLGMMGGAVRPRPKSVIGMRSSKSVDEGRGMFLVRQMTGTGM